MTLGSALQEQAGLDSAFPRHKGVQCVMLFIWQVILNYDDRGKNNISRGENMKGKVDKRTFQNVHNILYSPGPTKLSGTMSVHVLNNTVTTSHTKWAPEMWLPWL